jgi:hypothetical protein
VADGDGDDPDPLGRKERLGLAGGEAVGRGHDDLLDPQRQRPLLRDLERGVRVVLAAFLKDQCLEFHDTLL